LWWDPFIREGITEIAGITGDLDRSIPPNTKMINIKNSWTIKRISEIDYTISATP
jgi:hypothetical protein